MNSEYTSGFVDQPNNSHTITGEQVAIQLFFSSPSGYTQIFQVRRLGRIQLLKTLSPEYRGQEFYEQALYKEFCIGYQIEHEHICRVEGWEHVEGIGNCIVMEYIDGETLQSLMDSGRLTAEKAWSIARETASALAYMHSKQILHRDLKPQNIMITHRGGYVKLIDFSLSDSDDYYILKQSAGTPFYMAPEVREGKGPVDCRSDIYSLGVIMSEMVRLTGDRRLRSIANHCLHELPQHRYQSATELISALNAQSGHRMSWLIAASVVAIVIVLGWWVSSSDFQLPTFNLQSSAPDTSTIVMGKGNVVLGNDLLFNDSLKTAP